MKSEEFDAEFARKPKSAEASAKVYTAPLIIDLLPLVDDAGEKQFVPATPDYTAPVPVQKRRPTGGLFDPFDPITQEMLDQIHELTLKTLNEMQYWKMPPGWKP